ncbi:MAG: hypothetical protein R3F59_19920 [Myxococcota bacterium]
MKWLRGGLGGGGVALVLACGGGEAPPDPEPTPRPVAARPAPQPLEVEAVSVVRQGPGCDYFTVGSNQTVFVSTVTDAGAPVAYLRVEGRDAVLSREPGVEERWVGDGVVVAVDMREAQAQEGEQTEVDGTLVVEVADERRRLRVRGVCE